MTGAGIMLLVMTSLWSMAYIMSIVYALRNKTHAIPPISLALNFAWELVAMFFYFEYVAIVWVIIDVFIVLLFVKEYITKRDKKALYYLIPFVCWALFCTLVFEVQIPGKFNGFYFTGFAQDLFMAVEFNYEFRKKQKEGKIDWCLWLVALFKLLGDFLAFVPSGRIPFVTLFGVFVLFFNILYIVRVTAQLRGKPLKMDIPRKSKSELLHPNSKKNSRKRKKR